MLITVETTDGGWDDLCAEALSGRRDGCDALLGALRSAYGARERAALGALAAAPAGLWPLLDVGARKYWTPPVHVSDGLLGLVLGSMSADGYVRHAAVRLLGEQRGPVAVSALVLRTVDWVRPVREDARAALLAIGPRSADEAAAAVSLLLRLRRRERSEGVVGEYRALLADPGRRATVRRLTGHHDPLTRRFAVELALELGEYTPDALLRTALRDADQVCRRMCAERLLALDPDRAGDLLRARSAAVRELAVAALPDDVSAAALAEALADRSRPVRAQARWKLYRRGEPPAGAYRDGLRRCGPSSPGGLVAGLTAGLGECGDRSDVPMLVRLADRQPLAWESAESADSTDSTGSADAPDGAGPPWPPAVRRVAVRALGRLADAETLLRVLVPLLDDEAPSVAREAFDALRPCASRVPEAAARAALGHPRAAVRRAALRLVRASGPWPRLAVDLELAADSSPDVAAEAVTDLRGWLAGQVWTRPDPDQLDRIRALLRDGRGLPEAVRGHLAFIVG